MGDVEYGSCLGNVGADRLFNAAASRQHAAHKWQPLGEAQAPGPQWQGDVVEYAEMRIERVGLEYHGDVALLGALVVHAAAAHHDLTAILRLQPGDDSQQGRFPASGGTYQRKKLPITNAQRHAFHNGGFAIALLDVAQFDLSHCRLPAPPGAHAHPFRRREARDA
jgi:hypothetical protein